MKISLKTLRRIENSDSIIIVAGKGNVANIEVEGDYAQTIGNLAVLLEEITNSSSDGNVFLKDVEKIIEHIRGKKDE